MIKRSVYTLVQVVYLENMMNEQNFKALRQKVAADPSIDDNQRQRELETINRVMFAAKFGELEPQVDRLAMIKAAAEKVQKGKNVTLRKKLKAKSRKAVRTATEDERVTQSVNAFDESVMYSSDNEVRALADGIGITDAYAETVRFDGEWN